MPYDAISDLPAQTSDLTTEQKKRFLKAFNAAYQAGKGKESSFRIAWAAAKNSKSGEVDKHLPGHHDQSDHGSWAREKGLLGSGRMMDKKKVKEVKERIHGKDAEETLRNANKWLMEQYGKGDRIEHAVVVDGDGTPLDVIMGKKGHVLVPGKKREAWHQKVGLTMPDLDGAHITHTHPNTEDGTGLAPLSPMDVLMTVGQKARSITAVTPEGTSSISFDPPSGGRERRKWARQVVRSVDEYERKWNDASGWLLLEEVGRDPSVMEEGGIVSRTVEGFRAYRDLKGLGDEGRKERARRASKIMDGIAHEVFNEIEGVTYESDLQKVDKRRTITISEYTRRDGTKVKEHERVIEGSPDDLSDDDSGLSPATIAAAAGAGIMLLGAGIAGARLRGVRSIPTETISDVITDFRPTQGPTHGFSAQQVNNHASAVNSGRLSDLPGKARNMLDKAINEWQFSSEPMRSYYETGNVGVSLEFASKSAAARAYDYVTDMIAFAPAESPTLYRGMNVASSDAARFTTPGNRFTIGPSSFSSDEFVARTFTHGGGERVMFQVPSNSRALNIENVGSSLWRSEREWITGGEFVVRNVDRTSVPGTAIVNIEQTGSLVSRSFSETAAVVKGMDWFGNSHESATTLSDRPTMPHMNWSSPVAKRSLEEMARLGNLPGFYAKHLRGQHDQQDHDPTQGKASQAVDAASRAAPKYDAGDDDIRGAAAARTGVYAGIGAGALGLAGHYIRRHPVVGALYGAYGLANIFGAGQQATQIRGGGGTGGRFQNDVSKVRRISSRKDFDEFMEEMSQASGVRPEQILEDFGNWLRSEGIRPDQVTKEHFHDFMVSAYGHDQEREKTSKHLIGRHDQQDHDPTQGHTREQHEGVMRRGPEHPRLGDRALDLAATHGDRVPLIGDQLQGQARRMMVRRDASDFAENLPNLSPEQRERARRAIGMAVDHAVSRGQRIPGQVTDALRDTSRDLEQQTQMTREQREELQRGLDEAVRDRQQQSRQHRQQRREAQERWG